MTVLLWKHASSLLALGQIARKDAALRSVLSSSLHVLHLFLSCLQQ